MRAAPDAAVHQEHCEPRTSPVPHIAVPHIAGPATSPASHAAGPPTRRPATRRCLC